jgi:hypothetical protein
MVRPEWYGAKGDGTTNDIAALYAATLAVYENGGTIVLTAGKTYKTLDLWMLHGNINVEGNGATLYCAGTGVSAYQPDGTAHNANSAIWAIEKTRGTAYGFDVGAKYDSSITMTTHSQAGNFAAGDYVYSYWGLDPNDSDSVYGRDLNIVRSVNATTGVVTLEYPIMYDFTYATPTPVVFKVTSPFTGRVSNLTIKMAAGTDVGIYAWRNLNSRFSNIKFENIGQVCFNPANSRGVLAENLSFVKSVRLTSVCDLCHAWGNVDLTLSNFRDHGMYSHPTIFLENQNRGVLINGGTFIGRDQTDATIPFQVSGGCEDVVITDNKIANVYAIATINEDSVAFIHGNRCYGIINAYIANIVSTDSTCIFRDNWIDGRWQGRHEVVGYFKRKVGANESSATMEPVFVSNKMLEKAVAIGYRIRVVGTVASGTLGPLYFFGSGAAWGSVASITADTEGYFEPASYPESLIQTDPGDAFSMTISSSSLSPADSIDLYVDLFVEH